MLEYYRANIDEILPVGLWKK